MYIARHGTLGCTMYFEMSTLDPLHYLLWAGPSVAYITSYKLRKDSCLSVVHLYVLQNLLSEGSDRINWGKVFASVICVHTLI